MILLVGLAALLACIGLSCRTTSGGAWKPRFAVLLAIDTLRADHLGCYGYTRPTSPFIDRLASEGVLFERAFSQANHTQASFASLLTGAYPYDIPASYRIPPNQPSLASRLKAYGVQTAASVAGGNINGVLGYGNGFDVYKDEHNFGTLHDTMPDGLERLALMAKAPAPGFLFLHGYDVHCPTWKPLGFNNLYGPGYKGPAQEIELGCGDLVFRGALINGDVESGSRIMLTAPDIEHVGGSYDGAVTYADVHVGLLMRRLCQMGIADSTLIVLLGDHGEQLCENGTLGHGHGLQDVELHVPLLLWGAGLPAGRRIPEVVELVDVLPTVMDYMGLPPPADLPGRSLKQAPEGHRAPRDPSVEPFAVSIGTPSWATIRTASHRLLVTNLVPGCPRRMSDGPPTNEGLYAEGDVYGVHDLTLGAFDRDLVARLREALVRRLKTSARLAP